ncbi:MAG: spore coat associated protein CotJA [Ruminiclostridium sp.]|nr:spore coat associated protein CotJA [Ruminiclostridium sp.]
MQYYYPQPITNARLAHAYVPFQYLMCLYPPETALEQGTVFPELDRPYGTEPEYTVDA